MRLTESRHHTVILPKHMNLSVMAHLAIGQLSSLGLNQAPGSPGFPNYLRELNIEGPQTARTLDERRIYLGCYYATSMCVLPQTRPLMSADS